jgi:hypothetical protein
MDEYDRQALRASALTLGAAVLAYAAAYVHPPGPDVAAVFGLAAVLSLATYYFLDEPSVLAGVWVAPSAGILVSLAADTPEQMRMAAIALAALSVVGIVAYPLAGTAARAVDRAKRQLRGTSDQ